MAKKAKETESSEEKKKKVKKEKVEAEVVSEDEIKYEVRLKKKYEETVVPEMMKRFGIKNKMAVPKIEKIVINMGLGEASRNIKVLDAGMEELALITGQKPVIRRATKAISAFKIRRGMPVGCSVTLRGDRMYEFLDRFISIVLPRIRDFKGLSANSFDGRGNYTIGLTDQLIFPEIDYNKVDKLRGMNLTIVTTAKDNMLARELLKMIGLPFRES
jgi:large subunit ribosomal protein L5